MKGFRQRFQQSFFLRHHMALILLATSLSGVLANRLFLSVGMREMWVRYPLVVLASYLVFLVMIRLWLFGVHHSFQPVQEDEGDPPQAPHGRSTRSSDGLDFDLPTDVGGDDWGCLIVLLLLLVGAVFYGAIVLVMQAPLILTEAAFEFFLAAGLIRSFRRLEQPNWSRSVLATTWKPFAGVMVLSLLAGWVAGACCPEAATLVEVFKKC